MTGIELAVLGGAIAVGLQLICEAKERQGKKVPVRIKLDRPKQPRPADREGAGQ